MKKTLKKNKSELENKITIDGQTIIFLETDKNIVDVTNREKIPLPAPCYQNDRIKGCCKVCVVEIDGVQKYACCTIPEKGMEIVIDRPDLGMIRKKRIKAYSENKDSKDNCTCSCADSGCC